MVKTGIVLGCEILRGALLVGDKEKAVPHLPYPPGTFPPPLPRKAA